MSNSEAIPLWAHEENMVSEREEFQFLGILGVKKFQNC